jgi:endonuclease/exonuclease/phosphatase family metal-dependent hydrolase
MRRHAPKARFLFLLAVIVGLSWLGCHVAGWAHTVSPAGRAVRVVSYNILAGDRGLAGIAETLKQADADLIALQEVDQGTRRSGRVDQAAELGKALKMQHAFVEHFPYQGGKFGVALLSRHPIVKAERRGVKGSRLAQLDATVRTPSGDVRVLVVHYSVTFPFRDAKETAAADAARLREATATAALARSATGPVLVLGDMNDDTGSPVYEQFSPTLQDACDVKGHGIAKTWNSALPITRIDYVWASRQFVVDGCRTVPSGASDHLPVVADLHFGSQG